MQLPGLRQDVGAFVVNANGDGDLRAWAFYFDWMKHLHVGKVCGWTNGIFACRKMDHADRYFGKDGKPIVGREGLLTKGGTDMEDYEWSFFDFDGELLWAQEKN